MTAKEIQEEVGPAHERRLHFMLGVKLILLKALQ